MSDKKQETIAEIVKEMVEFGNHCAAFGGAYSPERWNNLCKRLIAAHKREVAELRECLKEAVREKCPFTRMSCKHGEPCDYECGTEKWRKALEGANNEGK